MIRRLLLAVLVAASVLGALAAPTSAGHVLRVGALFPLNGPMSPLAREEYQGVEIARDMVNMNGGIDGMPVQLDARELDDPSAAPAAVQSLRSDGVSVVIGTYSSALSVPASAAAAAAGLTYWEAGAVADRVTGRALPNIFRVGASGANLGANSATFAATVIAPRLGLQARATRVSVVLEDDDYGHSVGDSAAAQARAQGMNVVSYTTYDAYRPDFSRVLAAVAAARPDVLILASYIPDGVAFRRAMLAAHLHVGALIGSTMAECGPDFGLELGSAAIGVFASDRPTQGFNRRGAHPRRPGHLRAVLARLDAHHRHPTHRGGAGRLHRRVGAVPRRAPARHPPRRGRRSRSPPAASTSRAAACPTAPASSSPPIRPCLARTRGLRRSSGSGRRCATASPCGRPWTPPARPS